MVHGHHRLAGGDYRLLADLHRRVLRGSVLGELGPATVEDYYRWVAGSPSERLFVAPEQGPLQAAAVLSTEPESVMRRFLGSRPHVFGWRLAGALVGGPALRRQVAAFARESLRRSDGGPHLPEVLQIFADPAVQNRRLGTALLAAIEEHLAAAGLPGYCVRTFKHDNAATLAFYQRRGFQTSGETTFCGDEYLFLTRQIPPRPRGTP